MSEIERDLPDGYAGVLADLKELVLTVQKQRQTREPWGSKTLQRLATDLKSTFLICGASAD